MKFKVVVLMALMAVATLLSCGGRSPQSQLVDMTLFAQSTMFASRGVVSPANYRVDVPIPAGAPITVLSVNPKVIQFRVNETGQTFQFINHRSTGMGIEMAFDDFFGTEDPSARIAALDEEKRIATLEGRAISGMTKEEVLMAVGPPPRNETPTTEANTWRYWRNRFTKFNIHFVNGVVVDGEPAPAPVAAPAEPKEVMYARCNVRFEEGRISWVNYKKGPVLAVNGKIDVVKKGRSSVVFKIVESGIEVKFENDENKSGNATWSMFERLFSIEDQEAKLNALSDSDKSNVAGAEVVKGMSKDAVEMSWCPPPPHETPSLGANTWTYWSNKINRVKVKFDADGKVTSVKE